MYQYRHILTRMRQGDSDREIARSNTSLSSNSRPNCYRPILACCGPVFHIAVIRFRDLNHAAVVAPAAFSS